MVGSLAAPLDFRRLAGQMQYLQAVQEQYRQLQASWLTPVEIFQPHYGRAVAACILHRWRQLVAQQAQQEHYGQQQQAAQQKQQRQQLVAQQQEERRPSAQQAAAAPPPLLIYEIGGGTGTLARNILVRTLAAPASPQAAACPLWFRGAAASPAAVTRTACMDAAGSASEWPKGAASPKPRQSLPCLIAAFYPYCRTGCGRPTLRPTTLLSIAA